VVCLKSVKSISAMPQSYFNTYFYISLIQHRPYDFESKEVFLIVVSNDFTLWGQKSSGVGKK